MERATPDHRSPESAEPTPAAPAEGGAAHLALHRTAGNRAVGNLIAGAQAKLAVGAADDPLEHEADAVADQIASAIRTGRVGDSATSALLASRISRRPVARSHTHGGDDTEVGAGGGTLGNDTEQRLAASRGGGRPLPDVTRKSVENAFGTDFSDVRVHTGSEASDLNDRMGAEAFTVGSDIYFRDGVPAASDPLLAHELTHVVQQSGQVGRKLALRKPTGDYSTIAKGSGTKLGTSRETTKETSAKGEKTTTERKAQAGVGASKSDSSDVFDGTTHTKTEEKHEAFAGAEAAVKTIKEASNDQVKYAVEALARAGAFGESSRKASVSRGAVSASAEGSAKGGAGASTELKSSVTISKDLLQAIAAVVEASAKVGIEGSLEGKLTAALGPLSASIEGKLEAFAGAMAKCKADVSIGITHVYVEAAAEAFAGAKATGEGAASVKLGDAEAKAAVEGTAMAGASAEAKGNFKIDLTGVELSGKAEAFAGVKAEASAKGTASYKGRQIFAAKGTIGVSAGIGGTAEGAFGFHKGKLTIKGDVAATLGIGTEVGFEVEIDFYELALAIGDVIVQRFLEKKEEINRGISDVDRVPIIDPTKAVQMRKKGYETYLKDFAAYDAKKAKQGNSGIKRERIQEILDRRWHANKENWHFLEFDEGVTQAAKDAFGSKLKYIHVQGGQIRAFEVQRTEAQKAHIKKERMNKGFAF